MRSYLRELLLVELSQNTQDQIMHEVESGNAFSTSTSPRYPSQGLYVLTFDEW